MNLRTLSRTGFADATPGSTAVFWLTAVLLGASTWWRAGNRSLPLILLEWLALSLLVALAWRSFAADRRVGVSRVRAGALGLLLSAPLWVALVQLVPLTGQGPVSQVPSDTWLSALSGLQVVAAFWAALSLDEARLRRLLLLCMGVGVLQALLALLQLPFPGLLFEPAFRSPVLGSFGNKNSLGNYLAMLLPLLWLWASAAGESSRRRSRSRWTGWGARAALLVVMAGLVASLSRAGLATGLLALALAIALLPLGRGGARRQGWQAWLARGWPLALVLLGLGLGSWDWLARFEADRLASDDALRGLMRTQTWLAAQAHWPLGTGLGTFATVFPAYQPPEMGRWFVNFAHNDYLQLAMECGVLAVPLLLAVLWLAGRRAWRLVAARRRGTWSSVDSLALACGLGFLAQALHAWVDYPWRIPATAMLGAFLLGVFLREPEVVAPQRHAA